ncbi:energy-coupling factor transporter ATPase [Microbacterium sp. SSW1-59]|uniref:ABC transporter ATP-binding protein n=1 Tax=Microbacterium xanthum TaxID=3079794 RepID=UPI002AD2E677|nr:energy-coupling factor transporter ATPase [Microbacterium sp. SSW1-59]MDZ8200511.1 energy-coupling factor transporter ATPase [Microbacterium sp. SSW1-59]
MARADSDRPAALAAGGSDVGSPLARLRDVAITHDESAVATPAEVSFDVSPGEVVLVLGPSGSGKSTLALALNGLIPHALPATLAGSVVIDGMDTAEASVAALSTRVGMVFQDPDAQLVTGTLLDEVAFGPENLRLPVAEVLARAEAALRRVGLWDRRSENPDRLSGGGRQRLAIACALAMGSPLLVLDEPTANLDPRGIDEVYAALGDLVAAGDRAIVLVEHNLDAAIGFVDRVVVLDGTGVLIADGPVDEVLRTRAEELHRLGVWLPHSTLAALRLRAAGYRLDPLPLTPVELRAALATAPVVTAARSAAPRQRHAGEVVVTVRGMDLRRGRTDVLHGIDLDVRTDEFVAVVGANGAGKTTLVQAIAGVIRPPRGSVHVAGTDISRVDPRRLATRIGFVFQNPEHQFIAHTVYDELAHGLRRDGFDEAAVRDRVEELLERFGLSDKADAHPFLLSGGQKRRLSVGTALIAGAPVLALDEPTFGQDRARAEELLSLLGDLRDAGTTILVVTHDMQLVAEHADRTIVVDAGRIVADGPTSAVFSDDELIERAGLRIPPLRRALQALPGHPELDGVARLADLPGGAP